MPKEYTLDEGFELDHGRKGYGEIQGQIHALYKEGRTPKIVVKEIVSGDLVDCFYERGLYSNIIEALRDRTRIVMVDGEVLESAETGFVRRVCMRQIRSAPEWDEAEFESLIGSFPDLTGGRSTEEYIESVRDG